MGRGVGVGGRVGGGGHNPCSTEWMVMIGGGEGGRGRTLVGKGGGGGGDDERGGRGINGEEGGGVQTGIVYQHGYKMGVGG